MAHQWYFEKSFIMIIKTKNHRLFATKFIQSWTKMKENLSHHVRHRENNLPSLTSIQERYCTVEWFINGKHIKTEVNGY
jgi:phage regulator Rha-like protein